MTSAPRGNRTSVEVANVSPQGIWLFVDDVEHFLAFEFFPWFRTATIGDVCRVERPSKNHLHWPTLDIDLSVDSLSDPHRFPLVSRAGVPVASHGVSTKRNVSRASKTRSHRQKRS